MRWIAVLAALAMSAACAAPDQPGPNKIAGHGSRLRFHAIMHLAAWRQTAGIRRV